MTHFSLDNYGDENTPIVGLPIKYFREHHDYPSHMFRRDFVGNGWSEHLYALVVRSGAANSSAGPELWGAAPFAWRFLPTTNRFACTLVKVMYLRASLAERKSSPQVLSVSLLCGLVSLGESSPFTLMAWAAAGMCRRGRYFHYPSPRSILHREYCMGDSK